MTNSLGKIFSERLGKFRKEKNMTFAQLAEKSGLEESHISRLESGDRSPTLGTIGKLAVALEVEPRAFFR